MKTVQGFYAGGALWEVLRFFLFILISARVLLVPEHPGTLLLLPWIGGYQLALAGGFFFLALRPFRYRALILPMALAKFLSLVAGITLFLAEMVFSLPVVSFHPAGRLLSLLCGGIVLFDLLFLTILLSSKGRGRKVQKSEEEKKEPSLPEWKEIPLQEE